MTAHERGLLDTGVVVSLEGLTDWAGLPTRCFVSAITLAELSVGPVVATTNDLPVFTRNPDDFSGIGLVTVVMLEVVP